MELFRDLRMLAVGVDPPPHRRGRPFRVAQRGSPVLALFVGVMAFNYLAENASLPPFWHWLASIGSGLPLALLPRYPLIAWRIAFVVAIATGVAFHVEEQVPWPWQPVQVLLFPVLLYAVAVRHRRAVLLGVLISMVTLLLAQVETAEAPALILAVTIILVLGDQVRRRREAQRELAVEAERTALADARRAVVEERTRIARELHDVVAHHMSLVAVRAETAPYRLGDLPPATAGEFTDIAGTAREALTEMRRLLGVLREESPTLALGPQPGLAELAELVANARRAGLDVTLDSTATQAPPGVQLSAYRVVQEALSNAGRHAPGAPVRVTVESTVDALRVDVTNGPGQPPSERVNGARHGLVGMRERVAMLGGELDVGPTADGGFRVAATLPAAAR